MNEGASEPAASPILEAEGLVKTYRRGGGSEGSALDDVDFRIGEGEIVAITGPSGSGKSTLVRCLASLEELDRGEIYLEGQRVDRADPQSLKRARRSVQLVFQDPIRAIPRRYSVARALAEPMALARSTDSGTGSPRAGRAAEHREASKALLDELGLDTSLLDQPTHSLSGGQLQRLALARALATEPKVILLDETFTGLDLASRARLVDLLIGTLERRRLAYAVVSHDPELVAHLADVAYVLESGQVRDCRDRAELHRRLRAQSPARPAC